MPPMPPMPPRPPRHAAPGGAHRPAPGAGAAPAVGAQTVENTRNVLGYGVLDRNHVRDEFRRNRHVDLLDHLEHAFDVLAEIAQHQDVGVVNCQNRVRDGAAGECLEGLREVARADVSGLYHVSHVLSELRQALAGALECLLARPAGTCRRHCFDELVAYVDHGDAIHPEHHVEGLNGLFLGKGGLGGQINLRRGQGGRAQDRAVDHLGINLQDLREIRLPEIYHAWRDDFLRRLTSDAGRRDRVGLWAGCRTRQSGPGRAGDSWDRHCRPDPARRSRGRRTRPGRRAQGSACARGGGRAGRRGIAASRSGPLSDAARGHVGWGGRSSRGRRWRHRRRSLAIGGWGGRSCRRRRGRLEPIG